MPRFSVIAGTYNDFKKETLQQFVKAMDMQTFKDFEVHICDDGSNDGTKEYVKNEILPYENYKNWQYHRIWPKRGMRLAKNVNQGIRAARGEYCVFIMCDSFPEINYLEVLNEYANEDRVLCGIRANIDGNRLIEMDWRVRKFRIPQFPVFLPSNPQEKITGNGLCVPAGAFRKLGLWNEKIRGYGGDDNELAARLYYGGYLFWSIPQAILYHKWHKPRPDNDKNIMIIERFASRYRGFSIDGAGNKRVL